MYDLLLGKRRFLSWSKNTLKSKVNVIYILVGFFLEGEGCSFVWFFGCFVLGFFSLVFLCFLAEHKVSGSHLGRFETVNY